MFSDSRWSEVATSESTASTTYTDLATTTDSVTVEIGSNGAAFVFLSAYMGGSASTVGTYMSFAVSGANTVAASDANSLSMQTPAGGIQGAGIMIPISGLTPGSTTFKAKYRTTANTSTFARRRITVCVLSIVKANSVPPGWTGWTM